jgi:hypothetical protein
MTVAFLGVLAGLDFGIAMLMPLSLLGAAMLMVLALGSLRAHGTCAAELIPLPATSLHARLDGVRFHLQEWASASRATRAPPNFPPRLRTSATTAVPVHRRR